MADNCIDWHIAFHRRLLPTLNFTLHLLQCYNCHHMGHTACYCRMKTSCGLCSEEHDTRKCRLAQEHRNADPSAPLTCSLCRGHHAVWDSTCLVCKAGLHGHWQAVKDAGPFFSAQRSATVGIPVVSGLSPTDPATFWHIKLHT